MQILSCSAVTKSFGETDVLCGVSFDLAEREFLCLLGPSGCGKTTLLRIIAGLETLKSGKITLNGQAVSVPGIMTPPQERGIGLVFQDVALFPNMTVAQNIAFGLRGQVKNHAPRIDELLELISLQSYRDSFPFEINGGQQQRVALARALAPAPKLIMLDEPFSSLDAQLRAQVRGELHRVLRDSGVSAILVTHDQSEAFGFADRVLVLSNGVAIQEGMPEDIYHMPANPWVARFVGESNFLTVEALKTLLGETSQLSGVAAGSEILVRPEDFTIAENSAPNAVIEDIKFAGSRVDLTARLLDIEMSVRLFASHVERWQPGQQISLEISKYRNFPKSNS